MVWYLKAEEAKRIIEAGWMGKQVCVNINQPTKPASQPSQPKAS